VAFSVDQRSVDAWPFSMVEGSAANVPITGLAGGAGGTSTLGGGGGGGAGTFFLQPAANKNRVNPKTIKKIFFVLILNFAS
jgi:hypothetical protein